MPARERSGDKWLMAIGVVYAILSSTIFLKWGGWQGPLYFRPEIVPIFAAFPIVAALRYWMTGASYRWFTLAAFVALLMLVMWTQIMIYSMAAAAV